MLCTVLPRPISSARMPLIPWKKYTWLTPLTFHHTGLNLLPKRTDQNVKLVQTNVTRDSKLQHFIHYCNDSFNNSTATTVNHEAIFLASNLITEASNYFPRPPKTNYTYNTNIIQ